ncbi:hypothetical protein [Anabaena sp. UHCC 0399]|uniref:hypothetical protein n=1 Tax=Anabaena sp. UHCC 0399 TaxID=3110238 RepID=UPI002B21FB47|nr:hypothetical protein [Anabaena sp. UHCC 0399]MEA5566663.1 hypothetical protein [Anabaena sp. UHCC 0399]
MPGAIAYLKEALRTWKGIKSPEAVFVVACKEGRKPEAQQAKSRVITCFEWVRRQRIVIAMLGEVVYTPDGEAVAVVGDDAAASDGGVGFCVCKNFEIVEWTVSKAHRNWQQLFTINSQGCEGKIYSVLLIKALTQRYLLQYKCEMICIIYRLF